MTADRLYIRVRGQQQGPYAFEQLQVLIRRGAFGRMHEVSSDGKTWVRASTMPTLFNSTRTIGASQQSIVPVGMEPKAPAAPPAEWHIVRNGQSFGPMPWKDLQDHASKGTLSSSDLVWTDGMEAWIPAAEVSDLRGLLTDLSPISLKTQIVSPSNSVRPPAEYAPPLQVLHAAPAMRPAASSANKEESSPALISLIGGILSWTILPVVGGLVAVIFGHLALKEIRNARGLIVGRGRAVTGLCLGYTSTIAVAVAAFVLYYLREPS